MFWPLIFVIFRDLVSFFDMWSIFVSLGGRGSTYVIKIIIKIEILKSLTSVLK